MLFHGLPGGDVHGVVEEMDRRGKSESAAISSAIDMGESETVGDCGLVRAAQHVTELLKAVFKVFLIARFHLGSIINNDIKTKKK